MPGFLAAFLGATCRAGFIGQTGGLRGTGCEKVAMSTVFSKIITGVWPGHFVYRDEQCAAFLSINPIRPGHTLVVPIAEVSHWVDLDADLNAHLMRVAQQVGKAQMTVFKPQRVGMIIAGFEVPHTHLHVVPIANESQLSFANAARDVDQTELADIAARLAGALP